MSRPKGDKDRVTGNILQTSYCRGDYVPVGFGYLFIETPVGRKITNSEGCYCAKGVNQVKASLHGLYSQVRNRRKECSKLSQIKYIGPPTFNWNNYLLIGCFQNSGDFRDLMAYYHVTLARQLFGSLLTEGLIKALDIESWLPEMEVIVDEVGPWANNACWCLTQHQIRFGESVSFVLDSTVTFHEYAHAIIDLITGEPFFPRRSYNSKLSEIEQLAATTSEGYADYLACSLKNHPVVLECTSFARYLDKPVKFDPAKPRDIYQDSLSLSTGLWTLREELKKTQPQTQVVDKLVVQSLLDLRALPGKIRKFGLTDAALAAIKADNDINAGVNIAIIEEIFKQRGIL
jgi:hypothetical protein